MKRTKLNKAWASGPVLSCSPPPAATDIRIPKLVAVSLGPLQCWGGPDSWPRGTGNLPLHGCPDEGGRAPPQPGSPGTQEPEPARPRPLGSFGFLGQEQQRMCPGALPQTTQASQPLLRGELHDWGPLSTLALAKRKPSSLLLVLLPLLPDAGHWESSRDGDTWLFVLELTV